VCVRVYIRAWGGKKEKEKDPVEFQYFMNLLFQKLLHEGPNLINLLLQKSKDDHTSSALPKEESKKKQDGEFNQKREKKTI
jgi:hypothetical protein